MRLPTVLLISLEFLGRTTARHYSDTNFIKSFIMNEQKPTFVILCNLCWNQYEKVQLANGISSIGSRVSASMKDVSRYQDHELLFLLDLDCPEAEKNLHLAWSRKLFRRPYRWLILTNSSEEAWPETLWNSPVLADSDMVVAQRTIEQYNMVELHKPGLNFSMMSTPRGFFNGTLVDTRPRRELFRRRMDLKGYPLTMSCLIQDSNTTIYHLPREDGEEFHNDAVTRVSWMHAKLAFLILNATPRYIFTYRWGYKINGTWSGMIDDLISGRADIGPSCVVSKVRLEVAAYTDTLSPFLVRFIFRQPPLSSVSNIYALPFSSNLWIGTVVCATISVAAITVATKWERRFGSDKNKLDGGISDAVLYTISALSQQGCDMEPRRTPGRIMEWVVFTALMSLYAAYCASITVLLQAPSTSIRTLPQLAASGIRLGAHDLDYNHFVFKQYKDPVRVSIHNRIQPEKGKQQFFKLHEGVENVRQGLFAFHAIDEQVYRRIEETFQPNEKCDLTAIDFLIAFAPYSPMKKDSPYLEFLRVAFKRIRETGVHSALVRRHLAPQPACRGGAAFSSVGLAGLRPVLLLMLLGAGASAGVLGVEVLVYNMKMKMVKRALEKSLI